MCDKRVEAVGGGVWRGAGRGWEGLQVPQTGKNAVLWVLDRWCYLSACVYEVSMHNAVMFILLLQPSNSGNVQLDFQSKASGLWLILQNGRGQSTQHISVPVSLCA